MLLSQNWPIRNKFQFSFGETCSVHSFRVSVGDDWLETRFNHSLKMSTYLFAFSVHEYKYKETRVDHKDTSVGPFL